jgi:hypothetical protein
MPNKEELYAHVRENGLDWFHRAQELGASHVIVIVNGGIRALPEFCYGDNHMEHRLSSITEDGRDVLAVFDVRRPVTEQMDLVIPRQKSRVPKQRRVHRRRNRVRASNPESKDMRAEVYTCADQTFIIRRRDTSSDLQPLTVIEVLRTDRRNQTITKYAGEVFSDVVCRQICKAYAK